MWCASCQRDVPGDKCALHSGSLDREAETSAKLSAQPVAAAATAADLRATVEIDAVDPTGYTPPPIKGAATEPTGDAQEVGDPDLPAGTMCGEYQVIKRIGIGGMGAVYQGVHPRIGKKVAIKVLNRQMSSDMAIVQRFVTEARAVNQIGHPNIVDIFGDGVLPDGRPYLVMEFLQGHTLKQRVFAQPKPTMRELIDIIVAVSSALSAAHEEKIVHRDLKPDNIFIAETKMSKTVKLLDFGIAKLLQQGPQDQGLTQTGISMGTPTYMAPEQCLNKAIDARTDIYALGVIMYVLFTGDRPFGGDSAFEVLTGHVSKPVPRPSTIADVPPALEQVILDCLEKDPAKRPQKADEVIARLNAITRESAATIDRQINWKGDVNVGLTPMSTMTSSLKGELTPAPERSVLRGSKSRARAIAVGAGIVAVAGAAFLMFSHKAPEPLPAVAATGGAKAIQDPPPAAPSPSIAPVPALPTTGSFKGILVGDVPKNVSVEWILDKDPIGTGDLVQVADVKPSKYKLRVRAAGYKEITETVTISAGNETAQSITLTPLPKVGKRKNKEKDWGPGTGLD